MDKNINEPITYNVTNRTGEEHSQKLPYLSPAITTLKFSDVASGSNGLQESDGLFGS